MNQMPKRPPLSSIWRRNTEHKEKETPRQRSNRLLKETNKDLVFSQFSDLTVQTQSFLFYLFFHEKENFPEQEWAFLTRVPELIKLLVNHPDVNELFLSFHLQSGHVTAPKHDEVIPYFPQYHPQYEDGPGGPSVFPTKISSIVTKGTNAIRQRLIERNILAIIRAEEELGFFGGESSFVRFKLMKDDAQLDKFIFDFDLAVCHQPHEPLELVEIESETEKNKFDDKNNPLSGSQGNVFGDQASVREREEKTKFTKDFETMSCTGSNFVVKLVENDDPIVSMNAAVIDFFFDRDHPDPDLALRNLHVCFSRAQDVRNYFFREETKQPDFEEMQRFISHLCGSPMPRWRKFKRKDIDDAMETLHQDNIKTFVQTLIKAECALGRLAV